MVVVTHAIGTALAHMAQTRRSRQDILGQLLTGDYPSLAIARQRAIHAQLPVEGPRRLLAMRLSAVHLLFERYPPDRAEQLLQNTRKALLDHLQAWSRQQPEPLPVSQQGDLFVLLLADHDSLPQTLAHLYRSASERLGELSLFMGLASRVEDCGQYRQALGEARQALDVAESLRPATGLCDFSELGVLRLLQGIGERTLIDDFVKRTLGPLIATGRKQPLILLKTLDALLQENHRLQIHRNTLAQRIQRIEQQSGQSLDDPLFRMNAAVALLAWRMTQTCKEPA